MAKLDRTTEHRGLVRAFSALLDKGVSPVTCATYATDALIEALTDPERCGHVLVDVETGIYRCGRNSGHEGEHGRRR